MICENCGKETDGVVCKNCGLVINERPIAMNNNGYPRTKMDITTLYAAEMWGWDHPLSPKIRKRGKDFVPKYQKNYEDYVYVKAYEAISKLCASIDLTSNVKFEALNLFKGIRKIDPDFFRVNKLAPTYLACIKIACKLNNFPISNYELAQAIDYEISNPSNKNLNYMEKKFNRSYRAILKLYKLNLKEPEHPNFINYACIKLGLSCKFVKKIHEKYTKYKKYFMPHFKTEGYILALIYIYGRDEYGLILKMFEEKFHISSLTISSRKKHILKIMKVI
jgi:transcription initiation factor TFIIIB Brf1 subunit/transcription initiation factor TFIIB